MNTICQPQVMRRCIVIFSAILVFLMGFFCAPQLDADIYQWVDENGVKHFSNKPPANDKDAKIVSDEIQHDESAHKERLKSDQKTIDALNEEIQKEEQQASVGEQQTLEQTNLNQPRLFDSGCFSPSFSIQQGRAVRQDLVPRYLMPDEYEDLLKLLESLKGDWYGDALEFNCRGIDETVNYSVKSEGRMPSRGQFFLKSDLYSRESSSTRLETLPLYLDPKKLTTIEGISVPDNELISVSSDELVYVQKGVPGRAGTSPPSVLRDREFVTSIRKTGKNAFSFERFFYHRGELITVFIWNLENN